MLYIIGLGLNDENDMSVKGLESMKKCDEIYCEFYTNRWNGSLKALEKMAGKKITVLDREKTESDFIAEKAENLNVSLLVPGDPLSATTHFQLMFDCVRNGVKVEVIHSSSVFTAVACTGMELYKFGRTTTLVKPQKGHDPESPYRVIEDNKSSGLHTLVLLDIGMTSKEGVELMIKHGTLNNNDMVATCIMLGSPSQKIIYGTAGNLIIKDMKDVPCCLVIPGKLGHKEEEFLEIWKK